ncbi:MAG: GNAT family protein [Pedobacter sp.]|nr:GNAT family protein [Pedobacter sp.]
MTEHELNALGQPVGFALPDWVPPLFIPHEPLSGRFCRLEPLDVARHAEGLYAANSLDVDGRNWTWLPYGPFADFSAYREWLEKKAAERDPQLYVIANAADGLPLGVAAFMRIYPAHGIVEVGHLNFSPLLQRKPAATEAMYLMMRRAFELGYRRYEWKCNALNHPSRRAAERLGFRFEGVFRQALVTKGRNRDTAWYSVIDTEWPGLQKAFEAWLSPSNFDAQGLQQHKLEALVEENRAD